MSILWEHLPGASKREDIKAASEAAEKTTRWLWIMRIDPWLATGTQVGAQSPPGCFASVRVCDVRRPETPNDPGYITDDAYQCIQEMCRMDRK